MVTNDGLVDDGTSMVVDDVDELACRLSRGWWLRSDRFVRVIVIADDCLVDDSASMGVDDVYKLTRGLDRCWMHDWLDWRWNGSNWFV